MRLEARLVKLERRQPTVKSHPLARLTLEQMARMAREFLLAEAAESRLDLTNESVQWALDFLGIEPDRLGAWIRDQA